jgi:hypothetical protein
MREGGLDIRRTQESARDRPVIVSRNSMRRSPTSARSEAASGVKVSSTSIPREIDYNTGKEKRKKSKRSEMKREEKKLPFPGDLN